MKAGKVIGEFIFIFVIAFLVSAGVSFLYNVLFHGNSAVDLETSSRMGIMLGVVGPYIISRGGKK